MGRGIILFLCSSFRGIKMEEKFRLPFDDLAPLETFNPDAFIPKNPDERDVCNFVLSLAVFYNDFKDIAWAHSRLSLGRTDDPVISRYQGQYSGMQNHLFKLTCSIFHEIFRGIEKNVETLKHPILQEVTRKLSSENRAAWLELVNLSQEKYSSSDPDFRNILLLIRHKTGSHISPNEMGIGYKKGFYKVDGTAASDAYISRGHTLGTSRFYFGDVAVIGYMSSSIITKMELTVFIEKVNKVQDKVNRALRFVVENFIMTRGYGFSKAKE